MAKYKEMVYMCLDLLKEKSDDAFYTEEHIIFLLNSMRSLLLERKLKGSRNSAYQAVSEKNKQTICLSLTPTQVLPYGCSGSWLTSNEEVPEMVSNSLPNVYTINDVLFSNVSYIPVERMPYVGYNKWLKDIIYVTRSSDGHLFLKSNNPQFIHLENIKLQGIFSNPEEAASLACDGDTSVNCDVLEMEFPLDDAMIASCIEMVVQELTGAKYAPEDNRNNAHDDLADVGLTARRSSMPVAETEDRRTNNREVNNG